MSCMHAKVPKQLRLTVLKSCTYFDARAYASRGDQVIAKQAALVSSHDHER